MRFFHEQEVVRIYMSHNIKQRMFLQRNMSENAGLPLDKCLDKTLESHDFTLSIIILYFVTEMSI